MESSILQTKNNHNDFILGKYLFLNCDSVLNLFFSQFVTIFVSCCSPCPQFEPRSGPTRAWSRDYKTFLMLNSTEHKFIMLINVKVPTIISMINIISDNLNARKSFLQHFRFYEQLKFHAQLSWAWKQFYNLGTWSRLIQTVYALLLFLKVAFKNKTKQKKTISKTTKDLKECNIT